MDDSNKHSVDLSQEDTPAMSLAHHLTQIQAKGKKRTTVPAKAKNGSQGSSEQPSTQTSSHKLLKVIKQEK